MKNYKILVDLLKPYSKEIEELNRNIMAYGFYEKITDKHNFGITTIPFLILESENCKRNKIEKTIVEKTDPMQFYTDFFELGEIGKIKGIISNDSIAINKEYINQNDENIIFIGNKNKEKFYDGVWGNPKGNWKGLSKIIFDIESPFML